MDSVVNGTLSTTNPVERTLSIEMYPDEIVLCVFTNTETNPVTIIVETETDSSAATTRGK